MGALRKEMSYGDLNNVHFELHTHTHITAIATAEETFETVGIRDSARTRSLKMHIVISIMSDFTLRSFFQRLFLSSEEGKKAIN